jgi:hypothetical protein
MDWTQMQRRCPSAKFICVARLPGYRFAIARHSRLRLCGTANIFPEPNSEVWGIVYDVTEDDMRIMDRFEDGYSRTFISVHTEKGKLSSEVLVYIAPKEEHVPLPNAEYKRLMIEGARHWRLPPEYLTMLEQIEISGR